MATGSSALSLRHVSLPPSISTSPSSSPFLSFSPHSLSKRRPRSSLMASASRGPVSPADLNDPLISGSDSDDSFDFWPRSRKGRHFSPDVVASSTFTPTLSGKSLQAVKPPTKVDETKLTTEPPPDLESMLLHARVIYICLPLVPVVSEMVVAQLLYLQGVNPNEPIYLHISSTGTVQDDNEPIALESEGFAIYDTMMTIQNEVHTVLSNKAVGPACLLIAAGTKGKRYMMPCAIALLQEPRVPAYGEMPTSDLVRRTRESLIQRKRLVELLSKHTGTSPEKIQKLMQRSYYMDFEQAKEFGLVDKLVERGKDKIMADIPSRKEWNTRMRVAEAREG